MPSMPLVEMAPDNVIKPKKILPSFLDLVTKKTHKENPTPVITPVIKRQKLQQPRENF